MDTPSPVRQSFLGGLAALGIVAAIFLAGSVSAQPPYDPARDVDANGRIDVVDLESVAASWRATGSPRGTLHVFSSSTKTKGLPSATFGASRAGMNAICRSEDPRSHFCSVHEIETAFSTTGVYFEGVFAPAWVDNLKMGDNRNWHAGDTQSDFPLNCGGWNNDSNSKWGMFIHYQGGDVGPKECNSELSVACCK